MAKVIDPRTVFTPGSPISHRDLFFGRIEQIDRVVGTIPSPGRHPIVFGQRGVGKTSLVNTLTEWFPSAQTVKITCDGSDTFRTIWDRILELAPHSFKEKVFGFNQEEAEQHTNLAAYLRRDNGVTPSDVAGVLQIVQSTRAVFILDEFDRIIDEQTKRYMADLIKNVSDNIPAVTILLVGVATSITDLIGEHPSISRNLVHVEIPVMSDWEIKEIVKSGCDRLGIVVNSEILNYVAALAAGFPHYAHLIGLAIARACEITGRRNLDKESFDKKVCPLAVEDAIEEYRQAFSDVTRSAASFSRYPHLLCACAFASTGDDGTFRTGDVVDAMQQVFSEVVDTHNIKGALKVFCSEDRGCVLVRKKVRNVMYYRFREPMMRPFLRIKARSLALAH